MPVTLDSTLLQTDWSSGLGVKWGADLWSVTLSDGICDGLVVDFSSDAGAKYTASYLSGRYYRRANLIFGNWLVESDNFEQFTYASRQLGPLIPINYTPNTPLRISLRGLLTVEDEWALSSDPRGSNPQVVGLVSKYHQGVLIAQLSI